jgi:hypothetical protein
MMPDGLNIGAFERERRMSSRQVASNDPFSFDFEAFDDGVTDAAGAWVPRALDEPTGDRAQRVQTDEVGFPAPRPETNAASEALARIEAKMCEIATTLMTAFDEPEAPHVPRTRITQATILQDVAAMERAARRLRRFVQGLAKCTVEVEPGPAATPPVIDEVMQARARRALARSGFVRVAR